MQDSEPLLVPGSRVGTDAEDDGDGGDVAMTKLHDSVYEVPRFLHSFGPALSPLLQSLDYDTVENAIWDDDQLKLTRREQTKRSIIKVRLLPLRPLPHAHHLARALS